MKLRVRLLDPVRLSVSEELMEVASREALGTQVPERPARGRARWTSPGGARNCARCWSPG